MRKRIIVPIVIIVILAAAGAFWWALRPVETFSANSGVTASGFIESTDVFISPEISGRIIALSADEGDQVQAGEILIKLDSSILEAQIKQAEAALSVARASQEQALAAKSQALIYSDGTRKSWEDAQNVLQNPMELDLQITQARNKLSYTQLALDYYVDITGTTNGRGTLNWIIAFGRQQRDAAQMELDSLLAIKKDPQTLQANLDQMHTAYLTALAAADVADKAAQTATKQVDQAQTSLDLAKVNLSKATMTSPISGIVSRRNAEVGEIAQSGAPVIIISRVDELTLTVYVPESKIGLVKLGQEANITVDSYPGQSFKGTVKYISPQAEFTPNNVQTAEERAKTVFRTKIKLANPEQKLKSGMPADATIVTQ